jgi:aspartate/methionine/tyrosine aminotransferase
MLTIANRMQRIQPFYVMELLARAKKLEAAGRSIIHMEIGEPDFTTPQPIIQAGEAALSRGETHYTAALGLPELRQAISDHYQKRFSIDIAAKRIVITPGASGALQLVLGILINPGEGVLMADPGYPCNRHFVELVGGKPIGIAVDESNDYQLTTELVSQHWNPDCRAVLLASPSNPTGTLMPVDELRKLHQFLQQQGGILIVDEIYQELIYDQSPTTALSIAEDIFIINSFSKYFGMTGWRLGWLVAPEEAIEPIDRLAQNIFLAASTLSQHAALTAFSEETTEILEQRREIFGQRRDYLFTALKEIGFSIPVKPQGAFYLYAGCQPLTENSSQFANQLLETAGVAITPGRDFGSNKPEQHLRFAYTTHLEKLEQGIERLQQFIRHNQ